MTEQPNWAAPGPPPDPSPGWQPHPGPSAPGWGPPSGYGPGEAPAGWGGAPGGPPGHGPAPGYGGPPPGYGPGYGQPPGYGPPGYGPAPGHPTPGAGPGGFAPKPGIIPLRPLGLGEILDGAYTYIRRNPGATLGLSAAVAVFTQGVVLVLQLLLVGTAADTLTSDLDPEGLIGVAVGSGLIGLVAAVVGLVATAAVSGMLVTVLGDAVLGRSVGLGDTWRRVRGRVPGLVGLSLLLGLLIVGLFGVALVPGIVAVASGGEGGAVAGGGLIVLGVLVALPLTIWLGVSWSLATPAYTLERLGVIEAMRRSFTLVRTQWWRVFGILLLGGLIASVVAGILSVPFSGVGAILAGDDPLAPVGFVLSAIGSVIAVTLTTPFSAGISGLLYVDQRIRREAFDLELGRAAGLRP